MDESAHPAMDVIVVGGGPVGLGRRGARVLVIEARDEPQPSPKGQNLTQRTMEHFQVWGVGAELRAAQPIPPEESTGDVTVYGRLVDGFGRGNLGRGRTFPRATCRTPPVAARR